MRLQYYKLYLQRCFGCSDPDSGLITANYHHFNLNQAFDYRNMNQMLDAQNYDTVECQGYQAFTNPMEPSFVFLQRLDDGAVDTNSFTMGELPASQGTGWKFHILIADPANSDNLERGWAIVKDELIRHQIEYAKIVKQSERQPLRADNEQSSKVITVYAFKQNKTQQEWQQFVYDVSTALRANNIVASANPPGDTPINNSEYFSYRNDGKPSDDPFASIDGNLNLRSSLSNCCK